MWLLGTAETQDQNRQNPSWQWWIAEREGEPVAFLAGFLGSAMWWGGGADDPGSLGALAEQIPSLKGGRQFSTHTDFMEALLKAAGLSGRSVLKRQSLSMVLSSDKRPTLLRPSDYVFEMASLRDLGALTAFDLAVPGQSVEMTKMVLGKRIERGEVALIRVDSIPVCMGEGLLCGQYRDLQRIETLVPYRRQGFARQLVLGWIKRCVQQGLGTCLSVEEHNEAAVGLYEGLGFIPWWRRLDVTLVD